MACITSPTEIYIRRLRSGAAVTAPGQTAVAKVLRRFHGSITLNATRVSHYVRALASPVSSI